MQVWTRATLLLDFKGYCMQVELRLFETAWNLLQMSDVNLLYNKALKLESWKSKRFRDPARAFFFFYINQYSEFNLF